MTQWLGRFYLGQDIPLFCNTVNSDGTGANPTAAPIARIYDSAGALVLSVSVPIVDPEYSVGLFMYQQRLDGRFATGHYSVLFRYTVGADALQQPARFEILAGGNAKSQVQSMYVLKNPEAQILIQQTAAGLLTARKNPR